MAESSRNKSKSLAKYSITISVLVIFSHFSSQVPDFFDKNRFLSNLWDLIYLLVVGIIVCYGLFCTKIDNTYNNTNSNNNVDEYETYISGISYISSIFEDNPYSFDENDNGLSKIIKKNNPLGLPVRKLSFKESLSGLVGLKLDYKFKETAYIESPKPFNWRSKSMRLANETSHLGLDFNGLKSRSMRSSMSSNVLETNHDMNGETSFIESKPRESCIGGSSEKNNRSTCNDILKDFGKTKVNDANMDLNRIQFTKSKSQRSNNRSSFKDFGTTKADGYTLGSESNAAFVKSRSQRSSGGAGSDMNVDRLDYALGKEERAESTNSTQKPVPVTSFYKRGKSVRTNRLKEQLIEANVKNFPGQTADKDETIGMNVKAEELSDTELQSGEVDRKADEFIAKFREQIRQQKVASATKLNVW